MFLSLHPARKCSNGLHKEAGRVAHSKYSGLVRESPRKGGGAWRVRDSIRSCVAPAAPRTLGLSRVKHREHLHDPCRPSQATRLRSRLAAVEQCLTPRTLARRYGTIAGAAVGSDGRQLGQLASKPRSVKNSRTGSERLCVHHLRLTLDANSNRSPVGPVSSEQNPLRVRGRRVLGLERCRALTATIAPVVPASMNRPRQLSNSQPVARFSVAANFDPLWQRSTLTECRRVCGANAQRRRLPATRPDMKLVTAAPPQLSNSQRNGYTASGGRTSVDTPPWSSP